MRRKWVVCADDGFSVKVVKKCFFRFTAKLRAGNLNFWSISVRFFVTTPEEAKELSRKKDERLRRLGELIDGL